jgi:hypothetical protein
MVGQSASSQSALQKIHNTLPIWSVRVGLHNRVVGIVHDKKMLWYFIGTHAEYDRLIKTL